MSDDLTDEDRPEPWEKQPWETAEAFQAFTTYYLNMATRPRKIAAAYRTYLDAQGQTPDRNRPAPSHWLRWSQGKNKKGARVPGSITWKERAAAYDSWLQRRIAEQRVKRSNSVIIKWETLTTLLLGKAEEAIQGYDPARDDVDLLTLITALERFYRLSASIFGFKTPIAVELGKIGETAERAAAGGSLTIGDRFQAMAQIFSQAASRKEDGLPTQPTAAAMRDLSEMLRDLGDDAEGEDVEDDS